LYDDGAVVYINEQEIDSIHMPFGTVYFNTFANVQGRIQPPYSAGFLRLFCMKAAISSLLRYTKTLITVRISVLI